MEGGRDIQRDTFKAEVLVDGEWVTLAVLPFKKMFDLKNDLIFDQARGSVKFTNLVSGKSFGRRSVK